MLRVSRQMLRSLAPGVLLVSGSLAWAAGPRWVTGPPYFTTSGQAVVWYTDSPQYFTDAGDLSSTVTHAAADALVAAAAGVWNVPTSRLTLVQGGLLDEHVSASNSYIGGSGVVFPADVQAANYAAKQIAVIYDRDGSVTDLLLGLGASDPSGCRQSAVTESVDSIAPNGTIQHAILVLNGRCTGTAPEKQLQMQYQLMRAFGRVLGLGWSQTNDNVFTGSPQATSQQANHWPVMHPIDVICGPFTYQCLPDPFTLRVDDLSSLALLYFIPQGQAQPGHRDTLMDANRIAGRLFFPTGQGMQGVNVTARRLQQYVADSDVEQWQSVSSVSGFKFRRTQANAVTGVDLSMAGSMGTFNGYYEGMYEFTRTPMLPGDWQWLVIQTEPVNPLYVGPYSVGPYTANTVDPSGPNQSNKAGIFPAYADYNWMDYTSAQAPSRCIGGANGAENNPMPVSPGGFWSGQFCGYGQAAWAQFTVRANRTLTLEVTAEDEAGFATPAKAMPVIGVWRSTDALGSAPAEAVTEAFNGVSAGMTSLAMQSGPAGDLRVAIVDQRGDGRPDFNFGARVLYADSVSPASVGAGGGLVTITGRGFRPGNVVTVNGVAAAVQSWSATTIVAAVPSSRSLASGPRAALVADVAVSDVSTQGTTVMTGAISYAAPAVEVMRLISAPSGTLMTGVAAVNRFAVRLFQADGITPVAGEPVVFSASGAAVIFGACQAASCTVVTDATGTASSAVTPLGAGDIVLLGTGDTSQVSALFTASNSAGVSDRMLLVSAPSGIVYTGEEANGLFAVRVLKADGVTPVAGTTVVFSSSGPAVMFGACAAVRCSLTTDSAGLASSLVMPLGSGAVTLSAVASAGAESAGFTAVVRLRTVTMLRPVEYVAAGARVGWIPEVLLANNSGTVAGIVVAWAGVPPNAITFGAGSSVSDQGGRATVAASVGPLVAGERVAGTACTWGVPAVCAEVAAQGVGADAMQLEAVNGAGQSVPAGATLAAVPVRVTDGLGNPVAGAMVTVYQTVEAGRPCPAAGRCPAEAVLERSRNELVSDANGLVTVTPLQVPGLAEVTNMVVTAGTQGFMSLSLMVGW